MTASTLSWVPAGSLPMEAAALGRNAKIVCQSEVMMGTGCQRPKVKSHATGTLTAVLRLDHLAGVVALGRAVGGDRVANKLLAVGSLVDGGGAAEAADKGGLSNAARGGRGLL